MSNPHFEQLQAQDTVYALARAGERCYVARASGLYFSTDDGQRWQPAYDRLDVEVEHPVVTTAVAAQGQAIFVGVKGAILRSSNAGADWFTAVLPRPAPLVSVLALSPTYENDGILIAGTAEDGVFVSTDRGMHWLPWNFGLLDLNVYAAAFSPDFAQDQTIYIGTESGIFRSRNGGRAWRALPFPMDAAPVLSLGFSPDFTHDRRMFAGTEEQGLYASADGGATWETVAAGVVTGAVNAIVAGPAPAELWLLQDERLLISSDGGRAWQPHAVRFPAGAQAVALAPALQPDQPALVGFAEGQVLPLA